VDNGALRRILTLRRTDEITDWKNYEATKTTVCEITD
jgi:hypothetical protein